MIGGIKPGYYIRERIFKFLKPQSLETTYGLFLKSPDFPTMLYIAVTVLTRRIHICKNPYVLFFISYAMFVEAASYK